MSDFNCRAWDPTNEADLLEWAWGIIANANNGRRESYRADWQVAAADWREAYHAWLKKYLEDKHKQAEGGL